MSVELTLASKAGGTLFSYLKAMLDPGFRRRLDEEITNHVLAEIPRISRILEERIDEVLASGCTLQEAAIIAHQVVEAQQRTLDDDKRRRLSNVLVNGLCSPQWDKAKHRLLIRLTSELEEEHIAVLQWYAATPEQRNELDAVHRDEPWITEIIDGVRHTRPSKERRQRYEFEDALARELVSRALLIETPIPKVLRGERAYWEEHEPVDEVEIDWNMEIAPLGLSLLEHLCEPNGPR